MASIWVHDRKRTRKLKGHMTIESAVKHLDMMVRDWRIRGGRVRLVNSMEALMIDPHGNLTCGLYVEPLSPPSADEPGQPRRPQAA